MSALIGRLLATALLVTSASCGGAGAPAAATRPPAAARVIAIDDGHSGLGYGRFHYSGRWEHVRAKRDGRDFGTSSRSPFLGNSFALAFKARRFRIYGVTGPKGGHGLLALDRNDRIATLDFYSQRVRTHALVYSSSALDPGLHSISVIVDGTHQPRSHGTYVNVDSVELESS